MAELCARRQARKDFGSDEAIDPEGAPDAAPLYSTELAKKKHSDEILKRGLEELAKAGVTPDGDASAQVQSLKGQFGIARERDLAVIYSLGKTVDRAALDALNAGSAEPRMLVTDTIGLDQVPERFEALRKRTHECKVLIAP